MVINAACTRMEDCNAFKGTIKRVQSADSVVHLEDAVYGKHLFSQRMSVKNYHMPMNIMLYQSSECMMIVDR